MTELVARLRGRGPGTWRPWRSMTPTERTTTGAILDGLGLLLVVIAVGSVWATFLVAAWLGFVAHLYWRVPLGWWRSRHEVGARDPQTERVVKTLHLMGHVDLAHPLTVQRVCNAVYADGYELAPEGTLAALLATTEECKVCGGRGFHEQDGRPVAGCDACDGHGRVANWVLVDRGAGRPWPEWRA